MAGGVISLVVEHGWKRREVAGSGDTKLPRFGYVTTMAAPYFSNLTISGLNPESYKVQCESRVSILPLGRLSYGFICIAGLGLTEKGIVKTKESIHILGRQGVRLLLQAGLRIELSSEFF